MADYVSPNYLDIHDESGIGQEERDDLHDFVVEDGGEKG